MGIIEQGRALAEEQFKNGGFVEKLNAYECDGESFKGTKGCGSYIVTIDRHPGVTPFMLKCGNCGGFAHSKMYRVQPDLTPTHEWYRPEKASDVPLLARDHVAKGGLVLRAIGEDKWRGGSQDSASELRASIAKLRDAQEPGEIKRKADELDRSQFASRQAWRRAKRGKL